jgi:hypothetical protein
MRYQQALVLAAVSCLLGTALADEPHPVKIDISSVLSLTGHSSVHLQSVEPKSVILLLSAGPLSSIHFASQRVTVLPFTGLDVDLGILSFPTGLQTFHIVSRVFDGLQNIAINYGPFLLEPLHVNGAITKITYEDAFLSKRVAVPDASDPRNDVPAIDLGGGFTDRRGISALAFNSSLVSVAGRPFNQGLSPLVVANAFPCVINAVTFPSCPTNLPIGQGSVTGGASKGVPNQIGNAVPGVALPEPASPDIAALEPAAIESMRPEFSSMHPRDVAAGTIRGKFFLKVPGPTYQAGWGWVAKAWQNVGFFWIFDGWSYVGGDGSWSIPVLLPGLPVRVEYQPANRFVQLQDPNANIYTWGDNWPQTGNLTDIGGRAADFTLNADMPGMDKLYVGATNEWVKFYNNGMNALRDKPIEVTFPNSLASGHCTSTDNSTPPKTIPWSCSQSADGKIWIISAHGDQSVVQHEIAHSINSFYWNGSLAPGSGGKHDLTNCFNNGIGLIEGFADFMPYWVQFDRTNTSPTASYYNISIETVPTNTCSGQTNEMRVAATFWDTYDYWNDGPDTTHFDSLYYTNQAAMISLFLNNKKDTMKDYEDVMKNGQPSGVQTAFENIFRLNTIIP